MANIRHVVVIRKDLNMTAGLMSAQVAHAGDAFMRNKIRDDKEFTIDEKAWMKTPYISVLAVDNIEELDAPFVYDSNYTDFDDIKNQLAFAIDNNLYITLDYIKYIGERSLRTLSQVEFTDKFISWGYEGEHIHAYCHLREEERSFKIERIQRLAILDLDYQRYE